MIVRVLKTPYSSIAAGAVSDRALKLWVFLLSICQETQSESLN